MAKGIFVHRTDSTYDDSPAERYQFPRQYLSRVSPCIGDWIIYYEPSKVRDSFSADVWSRRMTHAARLLV